jgi:hypothetical protein
MYFEIFIGHIDQIAMANSDTNDTQIDKLEIDEETAKKTVCSSFENANKGTQGNTTNDKQIEELKNKEKYQSTSNISTLLLEEVTSPRKRDMLFILFM